MRRFVFLLLLALSIPAGAQRPPVRHTPRRTPPPPQPKTVELAITPPVAYKTLANGMQVIVFEDHTVPLVTVEYECRAGSVVETKTTNGLVHLHEHMFFKSNRASERGEDYLRQIGQLGISYNGTTREELSNAYFISLSSNLPTMMRFMRDAVRFPLYDAQEFEAEKRVVLDELARRAPNPYAALTDESTRLLYGPEAYRKFPQGTPANVANATVQQMLQMHETFFVPNNSAVVVSGDVAPEQAYALAEQYFGDWQASPGVERLTTPAFLPLAHSVGETLAKPTQAIAIDISWQGPSVLQQTADTYAADVFSFILQQQDSRLQRAMVDSGLATAISFGYFTQRNVGPISFLAQTTPDKTRAAMTAMYNELDHFADPDYFTDTELANAKALLTANDLYDREKPTEYSHVVGFWWAVAGPDYMNSYQANLRKVTRADIVRYLNTYVIHRPHATVVLLSPEAQSQLKLTEQELIGPGAK
jgi:zinc protease